MLVDCNLLEDGSLAGLVEYPKFCQVFNLCCVLCFFVKSFTAIDEFLVLFVFLGRPELSFLLGSLLVIKLKRDLFFSSNSNQLTTLVMSYSFLHAKPVLYCVDFVGQSTVISIVGCSFIFISSTSDDPIKSCSFLSDYYVGSE